MSEPSDPRSVLVVASANREVREVADREVTTRHCYCGLWRKDPSVLEAQGIPRGFCGLCDRCGEPGHTRHFPGALPYTGSWCDMHYRRLSLLHPAAQAGSFIWLGVAIAIVLACCVLFAAA
jgi:hypothetical protein